MTDDSAVPWLDDSEQLAWRSFMNGSQRLFDAINDSLVESAGLTFSDYRILVLLSETDSMRMSDLADGALSSKSTISRRVDRMAENGWVERMAKGHDKDQRNRVCRITEPGRLKLHEAAKGHVVAVRTYLLDHLEDHERDAMTTTFTKVDRWLRDNPAARVK
ncbi:MarR family winged helix-turn-helix transcriptional regulator [Nocardia sp. 348MFTsu5.1]|uniref:MarR family winged helix-turn-helix transcriptional regulator n=1 Tax=Nocardia sp. 348MFTsu5.1 TaxID=1172185 RepID=UPI000371E9BF|nr:MarR family transcriptional regulator [Nocardia sp. 348MFTsu5.1]